VLQGDGVEIVLSGHTEVRGHVTYSKFDTFPDAPISSFALTLPQGPHSALAKQRRLKTKVRLVFTPRRGKKLTKTVAVSFG
jgi:hypothetical protein